MRGFTPTGDAAEKFAIADGQAKWKSPIDARRSSLSRRPRCYVAFGGPMQLNAQLVERLLASPDKSLRVAAGWQSHG